jgi:hypothetical protein
MIAPMPPTGRERLAEIVAYAAISVVLAIAVLAVVWAFVDAAAG